MHIIFFSLIRNFKKLVLTRSLHEGPGEKRLQPLWLCSTFIGRTQKLTSKMTLLCKQVKIPKITYSGITWWGRMVTVQARSELNRPHYAHMNNENNPNVSAIDVLRSATT